MKALIITIVILAVLGLLAYTNPGMQAYQEYVHQRLVQKSTSGQDDLRGAAGMLFSGLASSVLAKATTRSDYVFWSVYNTDFGNEQGKFIGILNNFIVLKSPKAFEKDSNLVPARPAIG